MNIRKYLKKKNYLVKLCLTIAGFVCIPLIIAQLIMMEQSAQGFTALNEENIYENLQESTHYFAKQLESMRTTAIKLSQDITVRKAAKEESSEYAIWEAAKKIEEYSNDFWQAGVWFQHDDSILYNFVKLKPEEFYNMIAGENALCRETLEHFFEMEELMRVTSTAAYEDKQHNVVVVAKPVSFVSVIKKDATVFFVIEQEKLEKEIYERFHDCAGVALLDASGNFLVRSDVYTKELCEQEGFKEFLSSHGQATYEARSEDKNIHIYKYQDVSKGYTCLVSIHEDNIETHLRLYVSNIRNILIVSIILICMLLVVTVNINYRPIKVLATKHADKADSKELSELELLDSAFFAIDQKVSSQKKLLVNFMISDLLSGKPVDDHLLESYFPKESIGGSCVLALNGPAITSIQSAKITDAIKETCGCDTYITGITYRPQILLICVWFKEIDIEILQQQITDILTEITSNTYSTNCGPVVEKIADIRASYLKTLALSREKDEESEELNERVAEAIQKFGESLYTGDAAKIQKLLDVAESRIVSIKKEDALQKYYCYKLLTVYFANAKDLQSLKEEKERLIGFEDTRQLFVMLRQSVRRLCVKLNDNEQVTANKLRKKLLSYVDVNFNNQNLCLTSAADYLETSIYVVSRLFKEATGKGFKEYITDKRLDYARELLHSTNYSVAEISAMAGFENTAYFSSLFKGKFGLPPVQYRKKHQE